jgi:hypothetical protein
MQDPPSEPTAWQTELAVDDHVLLRHGDVLLTLTAQEATKVGVALLAASVVCHSKSRRPPPGTKIENCHFPVTTWSTGRSTANGHPVLLLTIPGGQVMVFQMTGTMTEAVGRAMVREAEAGRLPTGQKPN